MVPLSVLPAILPSCRLRTAATTRRWHSLSCRKLKMVAVRDVCGEPSQLDIASSDLRYFFRCSES
jgi:hypothetical protein